MADWKVVKVEEAIKDMLKEEKRQFMVVYSLLPEQYHGYLQELPQKSRVMKDTIDADEMKRLQKEYGWDRVSNWEGKGVYVTAYYPYFGLDGHLAMLHDTYKNVVIDTETCETSGESHKFWIKATVKADSIQSVGLCECEVGKDGKIENLEKPTSQAIRKAINTMGIGRFPTQKTRYREDPQIIAFREFLKDKK